LAAIEMQLPAGARCFAHVGVVECATVSTVAFQD
jgi:hypothetical protein